MEKELYFFLSIEVVFKVLHLNAKM